MKFLRELISWILAGVVAFGLAFIISNYLILNAIIPSGSMEPTIFTDDRLIASRLTYQFREPRRFDIIIFRPPHDPDIDYVKRLIGLPGETLWISEGIVYIDGELLEGANAYIKDAPSGTFGPFVIPDDEFFVLGDNRNNSADSRMWAYPFVSRDAIIGHALFKYYRGFEILN